MDQKIAVIQKANEEFQKYQSRFPILDTAVPLGPQWGDFAQEVARAASESGVELKSLTFGPVGGSMEGVSDVLGVVFSLTGTGTYPSLRKFAARVDESRRVAVVSSVTVTTDSLSVSGAVGFIPETGGQ
jgi:Tfp pilus assembly protein PilO